MFLRKILRKIVSPRSPAEDERSRELILNILLFFSICGFAILNLVRLIDLLTYGVHDRGLPIIATLLILAFFLGLFYLSRRGFIKTAAWLLIVTYSLPMFYCYLTWGADLPAALLLTVLIVTLCGILISARLVLISTVAINVFLIILTYYQSTGLVKVKNYWRQENHQLSDAVTYAVLLLVIASVAWLFCREIKRALKRARESERDLKDERDSLEVKVRERTDELRQAEAEKINQLYRLAEFGRLSSGIFHDLMNPLTAISLNLEQIKTDSAVQIVTAKSFLSQAILATRKMEDLVASIKKQIQRESNINEFSLNKEIEQILQILAYQARRAKVAINFNALQEIKLKGDAVKFGQIVTNLLVNAIEACETGADENCRVVTINLSLDQEKITLVVSDNGCGIIPEILNKIFLPFFSTKTETGRGLGLGLASTKSLTEKNFGGQIGVESSVGQGTKFTVSLPLYYETRNNLLLAELADKNLAG